jgi:hypothetical protein
MENEYPYAGCDGQYPWSSKRPWDMIDYSQPGPAGQWQDQGKRICLAGSFGSPDIQMEMISDTDPLLSNAALEPPGFMESSVNFSGLPGISDLPWSNDGSGASPMNLQLLPDLWGDRFLLPASYFPPSSGTVDTKEMWTTVGSSNALERFTGSLGTVSMPYPGRSTSDNLVHYPEDSRISLTHLDHPAIDYLGLPNAGGGWNQHIKHGNGMPLMPVELPSMATLHIPTGAGIWSQPNQLNAQTPLLQLCHTRVDSLDSIDIPKATILNQDSPLNSNLIHDTTIPMDGRSTESETSKAPLFQLQQIDSMRWNSTPLPISDNCSQTSYDCSQNRVSENVTTTLVDDSKYPSRAESLQSIQFEKSALERGLAEDCSSFQSQVAQNQETLNNALPEQSEETNEVEYDTCFGMVRLM